jgi:hypothetical protein
LLDVYYLEKSHQLPSPGGTLLKGLVLTPKFGKEYDWWVQFEKEFVWWKERYF